MKTVPKYITVKMLKDNGACGAESFRRVFGNRAAVTYENARRAEQESCSTEDLWFFLGIDGKTATELERCQWEIVYLFHGDELALAHFPELYAFAFMTVWEQYLPMLLEDQ